MTERETCRQCGGEPVFVTPPAFGGGSGLITCNRCMGSGYELEPIKRTVWSDCGPEQFDLYDPRTYEVLKANAPQAQD